MNYILSVFRLCIEIQKFRIPLLHTNKQTHVMTDDHNNGEGKLQLQRSDMTIDSDSVGKA